MHFNCPLCSRESKVGVAKKNLVLQKKFGPLSLALKSVAVKDEKCHSQQALNCLLDHVCSIGLALPTRCVLCWGFCSAGQVPTWCVLCRPSLLGVAFPTRCVLCRPWLLGVCSEGLPY